MPNLKSVEISDEVTGIGQDAFYQCPVLEYVSIGKGVKYIGDSAFSICKALRQIEIPGNVRKIGVHAFFGCSHIQKVVLHEGIESIGNMAFSVCTDLEEIIFPNSIKCVEGYVFDKSKWQAAHTEDFVILGKTLFYYNGAEYHSIRVPEGIEVITSTAFNMRSFYDISFPSSLRYICPRAFRGNHYVEKIILPDGLIEIGAEAFDGAKVLKSIAVPGSVIRIALRGVPADKVVGAPKTGYILAGSAVVGCNGNQKRVIIHEGAYSISPYAFYQKYKLEEVILPSSLREIRKDAFLSCSHLKKITIPAGVRLIEEGAIHSSTVTIIVEHDSVAEQYALSHNINVIYM